MSFHRLIPRVVPVAFAGFVAGCAGESDYDQPQYPPGPPPAPSVEATPAPEPYSQATPPGGPAPAAPNQANDSTAPPPPPPAPPQAAAEPPPQAPSPPPPASPPASPSAPPPAAAPPVYTYPTGQWVYLSGQGWVWVPSGANTTEVDGVPYAYLYTPAFGWTWYVSPWGWGPYHYGVWVRHPWHPVGWRGRWVAHPHVIVRLGPRGWRR